MLKIWEIKQSDKRDRCNDCLKPFKLGQFKHKISTQLRFNNVCKRCYDKRNEGNTDKLL